VFDTLEKPDVGSGTRLMILEVSEPDRSPRKICRDPDSKTIDDTVKRLPWSDITFVVLKCDEENWFEGSGSLQSGVGLSAAYMKDGIVHVSARAPGSLDEIIALLQSYRSGDGNWQHMIEWD
jgi:hypothetical protein